MLTATSAGAAVGVLAAAFAVLFMKTHKVMEKLVRLLGLHVSVTAKTWCVVYAHGVCNDQHMVCAMISILFDVLMIS